MNIDFTVNLYSQLLSELKNAGYEFQTFREYLLQPRPQVVILRHDVDKKPLHSLRFAQIEHQLKIPASYYFRIVPSSLDPGAISLIRKLGHEIGYHYEDMDLAKGDPTLAIQSFERNLQKLRRLAPIDTICMHGSPLSRYDNRELWVYYDYKGYGITGEPYFDLDYSKVFYVTDTGRKWNNKEASIRDKVSSPFQIDIHDTKHFIELASNQLLPDLMMINTHPQRWNNDWFSWFLEYTGQNLKNMVKRLVVKSGR